MSESRIPDLDERRRALDPVLSFIVQAPAGSGKTELLIQRYLRLLAHVDHPEEVVAVTFTRKAAGEMRERVLEALSAAQAGTAAASDHERLTLELASAALQRDHGAGWCIADNPARLRIQTMDALCASLTRQMPVLSQFGSQPRIVEDASELHLEAARATVALIESGDAVARDIERLLEHLDNNVARIEELLADMLRRRDHWLRHLRRGDRAALEFALHNARRAALARAREAVPPPLSAELRALTEYAFGQLGRNAFVDEVEDWTALAGTWLTDKGDWRKTVTKAQGFPADKAAQPGKQRALALLAALCEHEQLRAALAAMRRLPPPHYRDEQWQVLEAILRLLPHAVAQLKLLFQAHGEVDFTEVSQAALRALGSDEAPTDLALALDYRIRHLLIDEFQDTSISQYELVARLTAGWQWEQPGAGSRTVFAVGDPMQSIYRFREAAVGLFLRARATGIGSVRLQPIRLSANFRSQAGIVDWVNAAFARIMPPREDVATGAVPYTASVATRAAIADAAVTVHPFFDGDRAGEADAVVDIVTRARHDAPDARVAILVRNRGHLRDIVPRLKEAGLRFRALEIEQLGHRPVVQDLVVLTRALSHAADRMAWLALLRAPWCGLTLADLHALAGADHVHTVWELMNDDARLAVLGDDGCARLRRVRTVLAQCLAHRARASLRERVAGAWFALGGPACVEDSTDLEDAEIYFEYLETHDEAGNITDPAMFEQGLGKLYALPDLRADETLQVMTIHKAKGLEFDVVIVPGLGRLTRRDDARLFLWTEQPAFPAPAVAGEPGGEPGDLLLAPIRETGAEREPIYTWLQELETEKEGFEAGRLLYVAATRARRHLHLLGDTRLLAGDGGTAEPKPPPGGVLLGKLWPLVEPVYAQAARCRQPLPPAADNGSAVNIDQSLRRLVCGWHLPAPPPPAAWMPAADAVRAHEPIEFSWVGETARHVGSVVHRWLQRIAEDGLAGWDEGRVAALRTVFGNELVVRGIAASEAADAAGRVAAALARAITDPRGRWLLGPQQDAYNEYRITVAINGEHADLVIDRMFRGPDGTPWIVDYKTSSHQGADVEAFLDRERERYRRQLERYAAAVGGARKPMLGLYFPLLAGWREWSVS